MKGNKYFDEEGNLLINQILDLYDDYDYDDDYVDEALKKKKSTQQPVNQQQKKTTQTTNPNNKKNTTISNNQPTSNVANKSKTIDTTISAKGNVPLTNKIKVVKTAEASYSSVNESNSSQIQTNKEINLKRDISKEKKNVQTDSAYLNSFKYPKIDYKLAEEKEEKPNINIVIIGHVDSGKSTLMGHL